MNEYELLLMLEAEADDAARQKIVDRVQELVAAGGGNWQNIDEWGRRKLAYEINHKADAWYYVLNFDCSGETLDEVTRVLRITDGVVRTMAVNRVPDSIVGGGGGEPARGRDEERERPRGRGRRER